MNIQELNKIISDLPTDVQEAIYSIDTAKAIQEIGKKFSLHIDQIGMLAEETGYVMTGIKKPNKFVHNITESLKVSEPQANMIAHEVDEQIFTKIRESLKKVGIGSEKLEVGPSEHQQIREEAIRAIENPEAIVVAKPALLMTSPPSPTQDKNPKQKTDPYRETIE